MIGFVVYSFFISYDRRLQQASSVDDQGKDKDASFRDDNIEVHNYFIVVRPQVKNMFPQCKLSNCSFRIT